MWRRPRESEEKREEAKVGAGAKTGLDYGKILKLALAL